MKYPTLLTTIAGFAITASSVSAQISFSGYNWNTYDQFATGQYSPGQWNEYSGSGNTGAVTGRFGVDSGVTTALTLNVGDQVSYDFLLSDEWRDYRGSGASDWVGDCYTTFRTGTGFYDPMVTGNAGYGSSYAGAGSLWFSDASWGGWAGPYSTSQTTTGVHFQWDFTSATTYQLSVFNIGSLTPAATYYGTMSDIANIGGIRFGLWDTEQTMTIQNFTVTTVPEPSTAAFIGGGLALLAFKTWRRRQ